METTAFIFGGQPSKRQALSANEATMRKKSRNTWHLLLIVFVYAAVFKFTTARLLLEV